MFQEEKLRSGLVIRIKPVIHHVMWLHAQSNANAGPDSEDALLGLLWQHPQIQTKFVNVSLKHAVRLGAHVY